MTGLSKFRFGDFELDTRTGELRKHGVRLKIQDQPFQVLQVLLERAGDLVTREELQTRLWANDTFVDFDQGLNRAVNKIRSALCDTAEAPRFIETVPRRGYRLITPVEVVAPVKAAPAREPEAEEIPPKTVSLGWPYRRLAYLLVCLLGTAGAGVWIVRDRAALPAPRVIPLTTLTGNELFPTFSPDGKQVAFCWTGEEGTNSDLYVKIVGGESALRLTSDPSFDEYPAWSPDGRKIAFVSSRDQGGIYVVSPLGGPELKVANLPSSSRPSWSPDSALLLVAQEYSEGKSERGAGALFVVPVSSGAEPREVLTPPPGHWYVDPSYAPDGRSVAFGFCKGAALTPTCILEIADLKDGSIAAASARPLQRYSQSAGIAWTVDGSSLIYGSSKYLWRADARGRKSAERLELAGFDAFYPAIDPSGGGLGYFRYVNNSDILRLTDGGKASPFLTSTRVDTCPHYSPDGRRIAFASGRGGESIAVWVADADGTRLNQISRIESPWAGSAQWSPDGRQLVFDASGKAGGWDIWTVDANGGSAHELTQDSGDDVIPHWARDGQSVYFASKRSGRFEVWRVPARGGAPEQFTRDGGYMALESDDGKTLYYTKSQAGVEGLFARPLPDGGERQVFQDGVAVRGFTVFPDGVYYVHWRGQNIFEIRFYDFATGAFRVIAEVEGPLDLASGLGVSPDRKTFLYSKRIVQGSDLMLIEHFR